MNIFGIGSLEILFIMVIALIFIGPQDIGKYARSAGRFLNHFYRSDTWRLFRETSRNLRSLPNRLAQEASLKELEEIKHSIEDTTGELNAIRVKVEQTGKELAESVKTTTEKETPRKQESRRFEEGFKAWSPQNEEPKSDNGSSSMEAIQNAESDH